MSKKRIRNKKIILASGSKNRQQALTIAKIPFQSIPSEIDEKSIRDPNIFKQVIKVARAKVQAIQSKYSGIILGADGVNICQGRILEKPNDLSEAVSMLQLQSGQICSFVTGFYLTNAQSQKSYSGVSETIYKFRILTGEEIEHYVRSEPVLTWAAAFSPSNSIALTFVDYIHGSYSNFSYSLPFEKIIPILQREKALV